MPINRVNYKGKKVIEVRKRWPDGTELRRFMPNMTVAKKTLAHIEAAITGGLWWEHRETLSRQKAQDDRMTVGEFSDLFIEQHCKVRMRAWKRYRVSFKTLLPKLAGIYLEDFHRQHLHKYVHSRSKEVAPNTVNRDIACIKKMFSYALELGVIEQHPLVRFPLLPIQEKAFRVMTLDEFRSLVEAVENPSLSGMVAVLGETGIRKGEALNLKWAQVDFGQKILTIEQTKSGRVREVPLSSFAVDQIQCQTRYFTSPHVFINPRTRRRWANPEKPFKDGCRKSGLGWVGFHDLRRFRATQWVRMGIDIRTVQQMLGHADIQTTLRYVRFVKSALQEVRNAQQVEARELVRERVITG